jgi:hypothetical protein
MYLLVLVPLIGCGELIEAEKTSRSGLLPDSFANYWYAGLAEINTYDLEQYRYGEMHSGHATHIFVTEPFHQSKQVKVDQPQGKEVETVMKMNATRKFNTGIYPYSTMVSVFSPVKWNRISSPRKMTFSVQEWCGQTFLQYNQKQKSRYAYQSFSYFASEGDESGYFDNALPEEAIWNQIRLQPNDLPTGKTRLLPAGTYLRFQHLPLQPYEAHCTMEQIEGELVEYRVEYKDIGRRLVIRFEKAFPFVIQYWEEREQGREEVTRATLMARDQKKYWSLNGRNDRSERVTLGLAENHQ